MPFSFGGEAQHAQAHIDLGVFLSDLAQFGQGGAQRVIERCDAITLHRAGAIEREDDMELAARQPHDRAHVAVERR